MAGVKEPGAGQSSHAAFAAVADFLEGKSLAEATGGEGGHRSVSGLGWQPGQGLAGFLGRTGVM